MGTRPASPGPLDAGNVEELGAELDRLTLGGSHELIVDLTMSPTWPAPRSPTGC